MPVSTSLSFEERLGQGRFRVPQTSGLFFGDDLGNDIFGVAVAYFGGMILGDDFGDDSGAADFSPSVQMCFACLTKKTLSLRMTSL